MRLVIQLLLAAALIWPAFAQDLRFGVIGDSGTGDRHQKAVAAQMEAWNRKHPWEFVLMLGDNVYEDGDPRDFDRKFKQVYAGLMAAGVRFHATLGNHDVRHPRSRNGMAQVEYEAFGYLGRSDEYALTAGPEAGGRILARFLCLNSVAWLEAIERNDRKSLEPRLARLREWLAQSGRYRWNFAFFHHPLYSFVTPKTFGFLFGEGGHGPEESLRLILEPEFEGRLDAVFSGHEHFYQKIRPQKGVHYFISGSAAKIRRGVARIHPEVEFAAEQRHFMSFSLWPDRLEYQAVNESGEVIHSGTIAKAAISRRQEPARQKAKVRQ